MSKCIEELQPTSATVKNVESELAKHKDETNKTLSLLNDELSLLRASTDSDIATLKRDLLQRADARHFRDVHFEKELARVSGAIQAKPSAEVVDRVERELRAQVLTIDGALQQMPRPEKIAQLESATGTRLADVDQRAQDLEARLQRRFSEIETACEQKASAASQRAAQIVRASETVLVKNIADLSALIDDQRARSEKLWSHTRDLEHALERKADRSQLRPPQGSAEGWIVPAGVDERRLAESAPRGGAHSQEWRGAEHFAELGATTTSPGERSQVARPHNTRARHDAPEPLDRLLKRKFGFEREGQHTTSRTTPVLARPQKAAVSVALVGAGFSGVETPPAYAGVASQDDGTPPAFRPLRKRRR